MGITILAFIPGKDDAHRVWEKNSAMYRRFLLIGLTPGAPTSTGERALAAAPAGENTDTFETEARGGDWLAGRLGGV